MPIPVKNTDQQPAHQSRADASSEPASFPGGDTFAVDDWVRLKRFLTLGSEAGPYPTHETPYTAETAPAVRRCIATDGIRTVQEIVSVRLAGRAPKDAPVIFALALSASLGDDATRRAALDALATVCRTGTNLFQFAHFVDGMRGWGRGLRAAIGAWYSKKTVKELAFQAVKYGQRDGWSHRDLLRLAHPKPDGDARRILYHWITQGWERIGDAPHDQKDLQVVWAMEKARVPGTTVKTVAELIRNYDLPREAVPPALLGDRTVWEALLERMPPEAVLKNLSTLTRVGVTESRMWQHHICAQLTDGHRMKAVRLHPMTILGAWKAYVQGHCERGKHRWTPVAKIVDALDAAFYASFANAESTGKRWVIALSVSDSMEAGAVSGAPGLTPGTISAAMAMITSASETDVQLVAFQPGMTRLIPPAQRLDDVAASLRTSPGAEVDCARPILWALENNVAADAFVVYTDGEIAQNDKAAPALALRRYREQTGIAARLIVVGMAGSSFTVADPGDAGMLDVLGFPKTTPRVIRDFATG